MFAEQGGNFAKPWQKLSFRVPEDFERYLYIIRGTRVPPKTWGLGFVLLLDGSGGSFEDLHPQPAAANLLPDIYQDYIVFIPQLTNPLPGHGKNNKKKFHFKCPVFFVDLVQAMQQQRLAWGVLFFVVGFSRGAMWASWLAKTFPQYFTGVMLVGLYPSQTDDESQTKDALELIRVVPRVALLHGLQDDFSTIRKHEPFWRIILTSAVGDGIENRVEDFKTWAVKANHNETRNLVLSTTNTDFTGLRRTMWDALLLGEDQRARALIPGSQEDNWD